MPRPAGQTRRHILEAAYDLFYRKGFTRVGVDEVAALAGVTKRTLYYHFRSKDDLLAAVFDLQHELALARIRKHAARYRGKVEDILDVLFSELTRWAAKPGFVGAGFTRIVMELADLPGHPARAVARRHKAAVESWYAELLADAKASAPSEIAREIVLLSEGALAMTLVHGGRDYADAALRAAKKLVSERRRPSRLPRGNGGCP